MGSSMPGGKATVKEVCERVGVSDERANQIFGEVRSIVARADEKGGIDTFELLGEVMERFSGSEQVLAVYTLGIVVEVYMRRDRERGRGVAKESGGGAYADGAARESGVKCPGCHEGLRLRQFRTAVVSCSFGLDEKGNPQRGSDLEMVKDLGRDQWVCDKCGLVVVWSEDEAVRLLKGGYPRAGELWTPEEDLLLKKRYTEAQKIMEQHQRPASEVMERVEYLVKKDAESKQSGRSN